MSPASPYVKRLDAAAAAPFRFHEDEPARAIGVESQLFVDDHVIAHRRGAHRRLNPPAKDDGCILRADREWEGTGIAYGCVVEADAGFRLYYRILGGKEGRYPAHAVCMARSPDGVAFEKPELEGAVRPGTNIVIADSLDDFTVRVDPDEPDPARRYKLLSSRDPWLEGLSPATSPDGIRWTWGTPHAVRHFGDRCSYWYDPVRRKHVAWSRMWPVLQSRVVFHAESDDFVAWSPPKLVLQPDRLDHPEVQLYGAYAFRYRSMYLGYLEVYHVQHQRLDTQLIASRDGLSWTRVCEHETFLADGPHGAFDAYWAVPTFNPPVVRDGEMLVHFGGRPDPHTAPGFRHLGPGMGGAFGLARLREDGFVSLDATGADGVVETKPLGPPAGARDIEVNACPFNRRAGYGPMRLEVHVLDAGGEARAAYLVEPPADAPDVWYALRGEAPLPDPVRLRFSMRNCRLYSFRARGQE